MKKYKHLVLIVLGILFSLLINFSIQYIGKYDLNYKLIIGTVVYFLLTYFVFRKNAGYYRESIVLLIISSPTILILAIVNSIDFQNSWVSLPSNFFLLLGCIFGYLFFKKKIYILPLFLSGLIFFWLEFGKNFFSNKMQYGSFNQAVLFKSPQLFVYDTMQQRIDLMPKSKILILDFWNSHCGPCYRQFPLVDSVSKISDSSRFIIATVNVPLNGETKENNFKLLDEFHYSFKKYFASDKSIIDSLQIKVYPTTIIIENGQIIFRGEFLNAVKKMKVI